jgi:hypothetical protein
MVINRMAAASAGKVAKDLPLSHRSEIVLIPAAFDNDS